MSPHLPPLALVALWQVRKVDNANYLNLVPLPSQGRGWGLGLNAIRSGAGESWVALLPPLKNAFCESVVDAEWEMAN